MFKIWLYAGIFLLIGEFILPGLVVMFLGMGSLTVALGMHLNYINGVTEQLITFFVASTIYLLTLRFLVIRMVPTDTNKANINEDSEVIGQTVEVVETIPSLGLGRISHSGSTWKAKSNNEIEIIKSTKVKIIGRDNITWIVETI
jgi:membrane protein implicated in regulation of membrane protease activity